MIEVRKLTREEFELLISSADESESIYIMSIDNLCDPYDFFDKLAIVNTALIVDGRPEYFMAVVRDRVWTLPAKNITSQITLFKTAKRMAAECSAKYGKLKAGMLKTSEKNIRWTKRLGFDVEVEDDASILFSIGG